MREGPTDSVDRHNFAIRMSTSSFIPPRNRNLYSQQQQQQQYLVINQYG
jgi:hypothetical protein